MLTQRIIENIDNPSQLEKLYRADKKEFEKAFFDNYHEIESSKIAHFWKTRLEFDNIKENGVKISRTDVLVLFIACAISAFLIKIPQMFGIDFEQYFFYEKNAAMIVLFGMSMYAFMYQKNIQTKQIIFAVLAFVISALYINILPSKSDSHSINLVYLHLPLMLWSLYGFIYIGFDTVDKAKRMVFIKHNGELAILIAIILAAGGILAGVTIGLFEAIEIKIEEFYMEYFGVWGLVSVPIVATFIVRKYPSVANKISPIIANIFSPIVLVTLIIYFISIIVTGKDPYNDREFLLVFNLMLLGVMAIIVFSISETSVYKKQRFNELTLFALVIITLIIDLIAISAILYRLGEYGFTPNRTAVLGSNLLIFGNLVLIMIELYRVNFKNKELQKVELTIGKYLPVYIFWTIIVVFGFPWIFGFV